MNMKVVIVWAFAVILLIGLGILGYLNQDLLIITDDTPYVPKPVEGKETVKCVYSTDNYESTYSFEIKEDKINQITLIYKTNVENIDAYTAASNINQAITYDNLNGLRAFISGGLNDFTLTVYVNPSNYDKAKVEEMTNDYNAMHMVIDSITDVELYKQAINQEDITYKCE